LVLTHTSTTALYPLSLHDALPICRCRRRRADRVPPATRPDSARVGVSSVGWVRDRSRVAARTRSASRTLARRDFAVDDSAASVRSEEHTSELQSLAYLVCRLLL